MKYLIKQAVMPFLNMIFCMTIGLAVFTIEEDLMWLEILLCIVNMAFFGISMSVACYKDGQKAYRVLVDNDAMRRVVARTGEDLPINRAEEYKAWKGFAFGALSCFPSVVLLIIHFILQIFVPDATTIFGMLAGVLSILVFGLFLIDGKLVSTKTSYAGAFLIVPFVALITGIAYILGAKSIERNQKAIEQKHKQIHGEDL